MRWILAVVVGLTSVSADLPVCQGDSLGCNSFTTCCTLPVCAGVSGAYCCEQFGQDALAACPNGIVDDCECAAEKTDGPTAEPTPAPTPCRPCTTKEDCDEFEICNVPSARRGLRFGSIHGAAVPPGDVTIDALPSTTVRVPRRFRWTLGVLRRTDESYEGAVSPPRRLFVGAAEKRRKRVRPA